MGNLGTLLSKYSGAKREAESERESLLEKLGMQTGTEQLRLLMQGQTGAREALRAVLAQEGKQRKTGFNPVTGVLEYMDTGEPVKGSTNLPVYTPEQAAAAKAAIGGKTLRFRSTDGRELEI
jgi:hypothetical protein